MILVSSRKCKTRQTLMLSISIQDKKSSLIPTFHKIIFIEILKFKVNYNSNYNNVSKLNQQGIEGELALPWLDPPKR